MPKRGEPGATFLNKLSRKSEKLLLLIFIVALGALVYYLIRGEENEPPYTAVREPWEAPNLQEPDYQHEAPPQDEPIHEEEEEHGEVEEEYIPTPRELLPRVIALREYYNNPDIIGHIEITGTNISYPVVQTGNNVFYLYHDLHMRRNNAGSIFLDYENNPFALADDNMIIYGHNMRNGTMFHNVRHYHRADFFHAHNYILLTTPYQETVWDVFAFIRTTTAFCYLTTNFATREAFYSFILQLQSMSMHSTDIVLEPTDQILILSTCGAAGGNVRYVLVARLRNP